MSEERNKQMVSEFFRNVLGLGQVDKIADFVASDYALHLSGQPSSLDATGHAGMVQQLRAAFPDWEETVTEQIAEGDRVVTRVNGTGTHRGDYMGIPATGKRIEVASVNIDRIRDGRIAERWLLVDMFGAMAQLGGAPVPGAAA